MRAAVTPPFTIAQLTDTHIGASWAAGDPVLALEAAVQAVRGLPDRPDALLLTGDLTEHGTTEEYTLVAEMTARIRAPIYVLPGNHDDRSSLRASFGLSGSGANPIQYAARLGPARLVALDTVSPGRGEGDLDAPRLDWLDAALEEEPDTPTLIAMHHPPFALGVGVWDTIGIRPAARAALAEVIGRHPQVVRLLAGHVHQTIVAAVAGRPAMTLAGVYGQGRPHLDAESLEVSARTASFALHVLVDGSLLSHLVPIDRPST